MSNDSSAGNSGSNAGKKMVGGFEILEKIGQGAMGAVFKARQVSVDRIVALKVLPPKFAKDEAFVTRFLREARSAAKLSHPNIVEAIDAGQAAGYYYFAMEFVDGRTLSDIVKAEGTLPERRALEIVRDVARALDCAHEAGLIHRDVKPDNVLVTAGGVAKLADLGLAREVERGNSTLTKVGTALGTPDFISPEQVRGDADIDGRTDIYSLGATLYHLLVGSPPYTGSTVTETMSKHLTKPVPDARRANPQVSVAAAGIIRTAMAKDRDRRYPDAKRFLRAVERLLAGGAAAAAKPVAPVARRPAIEESKLLSARAKRKPRVPWPVQLLIWLGVVGFVPLCAWFFSVVLDLAPAVAGLRSFAAGIFPAAKHFVNEVSMAAFFGAVAGILASALTAFVWVNLRTTRRGRKVLWWALAVIIVLAAAGAAAGLIVASRNATRSERPTVESPGAGRARQGDEKIRQFCLTRRTVPAILRSR